MLFVKSVLSTVAQLARLGQRSGPAESTRQDPSPAPGTPPSTTPAPSAAMRQALAEYDVTNISPQAFSEMLRKLRQAGALSERDFQELSAFRLDLDHENLTADQRVNLLDLCTKRLNDTRGQPGEDPSALAAKQASQGLLQRQWQWLQTFARLHAGQTPPSFDALA